MEINYNPGNDMKYFTEDQKKALLRESKLLNHQYGGPGDSVMESDNNKSEGNMEYITE